MNNRLLIALAIALLATIAGIAVLWHPQRTSQPHTTLPAATAPTGGDFTLQAATGAVSLASFRGKVVLLYFGYTYCPDICPTSLAGTGQALAALTPAELARVQTIFISVDPERDTPLRLKEYAAFFHPSIIGVTGSAQELAGIAKRYGAAYAAQKIEGASNYVVDHSALTYLVAPDGRLAGTLAHATPPTQIIAAIRQLLAQLSKEK